MNTRDLPLVQASIKAAKASLPLLLHPSSFMNLGVVGFQTALAKQLGIADAYIHLAPSLSPYLRGKVYHIMDESLREALVPPVSGCSFLQAIEQARQHYERGAPNERRPDRAESRPAVSTSNKRNARTMPGGQDVLEEEDARKLQLLDSYITSVALARVTQQRADEQHVAELRQEQEALASEEWLQDEWDSLFGGASTGLGVGLGGPEVQRKHIVRQESIMSATGSSSRSLGSVVNPLKSMPSFDEGAISAPKASASGARTAASGGVGAWGRGEDADLLGGVDSRALVWSQQRGSSSGGWRPRGVLVADLNEHKASVSCLSVSEDNVFVATGSHDGTVSSPPCRINSAKHLLFQHIFSFSTSLVSVLTLLLGSSYVLPCWSSYVLLCWSSYVLCALASDTSCVLTWVQVKVWDCASLDKDISSRLTFSQTGKITAVCICERSHSFASGTDMGSVHVVRVDCTPSSLPHDGTVGGSGRNFAGLSTVRGLLSIDTAFTQSYPSTKCSHAIMSVQSSGYQ